MSRLAIVWCIGLFATAGSVLAADEPTYLNKSLSDWVKMLESKKEDERATASAALVVLAQQGEKAKAAVPALGKALSDKNDDVRKRSAEALMAFGKFSKEALPALEKSLKDPEFLVRKNAIGAIGELGADGKSAVKALAEIVDKDQELRVDACVALGKIGPAAKDAIPSLQAAIKKNTATQAARMALRQINPAKFK